MKAFFFDTYAFLELIGGSPSYKSFCLNTKIVTSKLQLMELYYFLLCDYGKEKADYYYTLLVPYSIDFTDETIQIAMLFRSQNKPKKLSYIDCMGYILAAQQHIPFLTGDKEFEQLPNVAFVK